MEKSSQPLNWIKPQSTGLVDEGLTGHPPTRVTLPVQRNPNGVAPRAGAFTAVYRWGQHPKKGKDQRGLLASFQRNKI